MAYMYILKCSDETFYTGSTRNLEKRIDQHNSGLGSKYTSKRRPVVLMYYEKFDSIKKAFEREKQIQKWNHKKKKALVENHYSNLKDLSKKRF